MATKYSLICWGGKDGKSVTLDATAATNDQITLTNHGLRDAQAVRFTAGTMPTGLALDTTYYVDVTATNIFKLYTSAALTTQVTWTGTGSGAILKSKYYTDLSDKTRWTYSAVEYIFDGILSWRTYHTTTNPASGLDTHYCEIGEAFDDWLTAALAIAIPAAETIIHTYVNGTRSGGWHGGVFSLTAGVGYVMRTNTYDGGQTLGVTGVRHTLDGIAMWGDYTGGSSRTMLATTGSIATSIMNCILYATGGSTTGAMSIAPSASGVVMNNIIYGFAGRAGFFIANYAGRGSMVANNLAVANGTGFEMGNGAAAQEVAGWFYNNISVGNTTNWGAYVSTNLIAAGYNGGLSTDSPWYKTTDTSVKTMTASNATFQNYAGLDFRPAGTAPNTSVGPQVDTGLTLVTAYEQSDMLAFDRPAYNNGGAEAWDLGPFEFDRGYQRPNDQTVATSGMVDGSRLKIAKVSDGTELRNEVLSSETTDSFTYSVPSGGVPVYLYLRKGSAAMYYRPVKVSATITEDAGLTYSFAGLQNEDIAVNASYAAGVATDWTINTSTGAITHSSGTTRYTVQDLYSYHQNYTDDSATVDDDPLMSGITPTQFELINTGAISEADIEDLKGGSLELQDGTLWSNVYNVPSSGMAGTPTAYLYQGTTEVTNFWAAGDFDVLLKVKNAGSLVSSGLVTGYARKWGYTFDHYESDLSAGGRNVMPLVTLVDANITDTTATVSGWSDVTTTFGTISRDFGDGDGSRTYYVEIDCASRPLSEVYQRLQYICRENASGTLNGIAAETYQRAHSSMTVVKAAPFGQYSGGVLSCAPGVWLINVPSADAVNYIVTDSTGDTHQNVVTPGAASATVLASSRVQLYNVDTATEIDNTVNGDTSYSYAITTEAAEGETLRLRVCKLGYEPVEVFGIYNATAGVQFLVTQTLDATYAAWGIDGSAVTEFTLDVTGSIEIDANDADGASTKTRLGAFYNYALTTEAGVSTAFGAITYLATNAIRINVATVDMRVENINASVALRFTDNDVRLYRSDGSSIIATTSYSIHNDYSGVPDVVETGVSGLTGAESAQLMGLTNAPSASTVATAVLSAATTTPIHADTKLMNGTTVLGNGSSGNKWRG